MSPTKHRVVAAVCLALIAFAILGVCLEGGRVGWDLDAASSFGRRGSPPFWFAIVAMSGFSLVMAVVAVWQLRLAARP